MFIRYEDVLHNFGIHGQDFIQQHKDIVSGTTRKFLDYVKSARVDTANLEAARSNAEPDQIDICITRDGYPIIPSLVMDKVLRKTDWEKLLRIFLTQHYCE
jgi:hypothetical protein